MRDDAKTILAKLTELHTKKVSALKKLVLLQADMLYSIKSGNEKQYFNATEEFNEITKDVDATDCDISSSEDILAGICGISAGRLERMIILEERNEFCALKELKVECRIIMENLRNKHSVLIQEMEFQKLEAEKGADELKKIRRYKSDLTG